MLISGFLAFLVAISFASDINRRLDAAIDRLRLNNALIVTEDGVARLKEDMAERGKTIQIWSAFVIFSLIFGSYVWVFGTFAAQIWHAWRQGALPPGRSSPCRTRHLHTDQRSRRLAHYGTLASVLSTDEGRLRIVPGHFDGASGLKPIGDFYLYQALLFAIPILWFGLWWAWIIPNYKDVICSVTGQPQFLFREWQEPFFILWLVVLGYFYFAFVRPFWMLRRRLRTTRADLNQHEAVRIEGEILERQKRLLLETSDRRDDTADEIDRLSRHLWSIRTMTDWPMDFSTLAKYQSIVLGEVLLPLAAAAVSSFDLGSSGSSTLQWIHSRWGGAS
jgi:hypothetical protein